MGENNILLIPILTQDIFLVEMNKFTKNCYRLTIVSLIKHFMWYLSQVGNKKDKKVWNN